MSLSDELDSLNTSLGCRTCAWYASQPDEIRAKFDAALERGVIKADLQRVCNRYGLTISPRQFREHCANHATR